MGHNLKTDNTLGINYNGLIEEILFSYREEEFEFG